MQHIFCLVGIPIQIPAICVVINRSEDASGCTFPTLCVLMDIMAVGGFAQMEK